MIKNTISQLLETEMERKDFLKLIALGAVAATGITQILKSVSQQTPARTTASRAEGYGASAYGGSARRA
jgi:hypothetical protein